MIIAATKLSSQLLKVRYIVMYYIVDDDRYDDKKLKTE